MKLLGVCLTLDEEKFEIDINKAEVEKETKKMYKLGQNAYWKVFDSRRNINKDELNLIRNDNFISNIRRKIWVIDDGTKEQEQRLIEELKKDINNELNIRLDTIIKMKKSLDEIEVVEKKEKNNLNNNSTEVKCPAIYKHFKGNYYKTIGISRPANMVFNDYVKFISAKHTETNEGFYVAGDKNENFHHNNKYDTELVLYKKLDDSIIYARPKDMFLSKVDKEKYPDVKQEYRFELIKK